MSSLLCRLASCSRWGHQTSLIPLRQATCELKDRAAISHMVPIDKTQKKTWPLKHRVVFTKGVRRRGALDLAKAVHVLNS